MGTLPMAKVEELSALYGKFCGVGKVQEKKIKEQWP